MEPEKTSSHPADHGDHHKLSKKEFVLHEAKELFFIILYLAASLCLLSTFRALTLIQEGSNEFIHLYLVSLVEAVALGKVVAIGQKLPVLSRFDDKPLFWSVLYKSALMTVIVTIGGAIEKHFFDPHLVEAPLHPLIFLFSHQIAMMCIFIVLFIYKDLDCTLGYGTLTALFFKDRGAPDTKMHA